MVMDHEANKSNKFVIQTYNDSRNMNLFKQNAVGLVPRDRTFIAVPAVAESSLLLNILLS